MVIGIIGNILAPPQHPSRPEALFVLILVFSYIVVTIAATGPIIAILVGSFLGMRHRGDSKRAVVSALVSSLIGYILVFVTTVSTTAAFLTGQVETAETIQVPFQVESTQQFDLRPLLLIFPQAVSGGLAGLLVSRALRERSEL